MTTGARTPRIGRSAWLIPLLAAALILALATSRGSTGGLTLQISMRSSAGAVAQVFWNVGNGFTEQDSQRVPLERTPGGYQTLRFSLPDAPVREVRLDLLDGPGNLDIESVRTLDADGRIVREIDPQSLLPASQIASVSRAAMPTHVVTDPAAGDPFFLIAPACLAAPGGWSDPRAVTPISLAAAVAAGLGLVGLAGGLLIAPVARKDVLPAGAAARGAAALWLGALFLIVLAAKLWLIDTHPAQVPYVDQWNAEAGGLYVPWQESCLTWRQMLALHNEHRIFFTRLLALTLFVVDGQWDPQLQQVVNAAVHAGTAVALVLGLWIALGRRRLDVLVFASAAVFALPFSWENTLAGFQSAFYLLLLFTVLAVGLTTRRAGTLAWCVGWTCAACCPFTSAGGLLTAVALGAVTASRVLARRIGWGEAGWNLTAAALVLGAGIATRASPNPQHEVLRAASPSAFVVSLLRNLAWPWVDRPELAVVMWLPLAALACWLVVRRLRPTDAESMSFGFGLWVVLQAAALAYARGAAGEAPASRYMDILGLGVIANTVALLALAVRWPSARPIRVAGAAAVVFWGLVAIAGLEAVSVGGMQSAEGRRVWMDAYTGTIRRFLASDDIEALAVAPFPQATPFWNSRLMANAWLRRPSIRRVLPEVIREPIDLHPSPASDPAFVPNGYYPTTPPLAARDAVGSFGSGGNAAEGRFESEPVRCTAGFLRFQLAGYLGRSGTTLTVVAADGGATGIDPGATAGERWIDTLVACPDGPFTVVAEDRTPDFWFAFADPVEVGWASALSDVAVAWGRVLFGFAVALGFVAARVG